MGRWLTIILIFFLAETFTSCSEDVVPKPETFSRLLSGQVSKSWAFNHYAITENGEITNNAGLSSCIKDNRYVFYANPERSYVVENGATKCSSDESDVLISDTWSFIPASATLNIELDFFPVGKLPYIVRELKANKLVLEVFFDQAGSGSYRFYFDAVDEN